MKINLNKLVEALDKTSFENIISENECKDFETEDEVREYIQERIYEQEIIYYYRAITYLMENDASLNNSLYLAMEAGCTDLKTINSELLATLLYQDNLQKELNDLDLSEIFEEEDPCEEEEEEESRAVRAGEKSDV